MHVGAREVERLRDERNRPRVDIPEGLLEGVQHGQQRSALPGVGTDRLQRHLLGPGDVPRGYVAEHRVGYPFGLGVGFPRNYPRRSATSTIGPRPAIR